MARSTPAPSRRRATSARPPPTTAAPPPGLLINGAAAQPFTGSAPATAGALPNLVIDKPSGTLTLAGTIRTARNWTYTAGTLDAGTSTVIFAGGTITGSQTLNAVDFRASTSVAAGTTLTTSGGPTHTAGTLTLSG